MKNDLKSNLNQFLRQEAKKIMQLDESLYKKIQQLEEIGNIMKLVNGYFEKGNER